MVSKPDQQLSTPMPLRQFAALGGVDRERVPGTIASGPGSDGEAGRAASPPGLARNPDPFTPFRRARLPKVGGFIPPPPQTALRQYAAPTCLARGTPLHVSLSPHLLGIA